MEVSPTGLGGNRPIEPSPQQSVNLGKTAGETGVVARTIISPAPTVAFRPQPQKGGTAEKTNKIAAKSLEGFVNGTVGPAKNSGVDHFAGLVPKSHLNMHKAALLNAGPHLQK